MKRSRSSTFPSLLLLVGVLFLLAGTPALALSSGCGVEPSDPLVLNVAGNTEGGDLDRHYRVELPSDYDNVTPTPLVFVYHAMNANNWQTTGGGVRNAWSGGRTPILVRPRSGTLPGGDIGWNLNLEWADVEFIEALKRHMIETYCIDEERIFATGGSSGGFGALGTGCHSNLSALVSDRGGIQHGDDANENWLFPVTPEPSDNACGPTPVLLGYATGDLTIPYEDYAEPTIDFFIANNECAINSEVDVEAQLEVCDDDDPGSCECLAYVGCSKELTVCTWDGGHTTSAIQNEDVAWFLSKPREHDSRPACRHERFDRATNTRDWLIVEDHPWFETDIRDGLDRFHVTVPSFRHVAVPFRYEHGYVRGAHIGYSRESWDVPLVKDFSVALTLTNLKYDFPELRLKLSSLAGAPAIEVRTEFDTDGHLLARAYSEEVPVGNAWPMTRSGPGGTRLWEGACWKVQGDPITDRVSVYTRDIQTDAWPRCGGDWELRTDFANPYVGSPSLFGYLHDNDPSSSLYEVSALEIDIEVGRNSSLPAPRDGYVRIDDVFVGRTGCTPESE